MRQSEGRLLQRPEEAIDPLGLESQVTVSHPTQVLGAACQSFRRVICAFNHQTISLAQYKFLKPLCVIATASSLPLSRSFISFLP